MTAAMHKLKTLVLSSHLDSVTFLPWGLTGISGSYKEPIVFLSPNYPQLSSLMNDTTNLPVAQAGNPGVYIISTP